jgi:hypothetical protein
MTAVVVVAAGLSTELYREQLDVPVLNPVASAWEALC